MIAVALEGIDGAGKGTQARRACARLAAEGGQKPLLLSFPTYETEDGRIIKLLLERKYRLAEASPPSGNGMFPAAAALAPAPAMDESRVLQSMMIANKYSAAGDMWTQAKAEGRDIVCDRFDMVAVVYGASDGLDAEWLYRSMAWLPHPNVQILMDLGVDESIRRTTKRGRNPDRYEGNRAKLEDVRARYLAEWRRNAERRLHGARWEVVDASMAEDDVHEAIWRVIEATKADAGCPPPATRATPAPRKRIESPPHYTHPSGIEAIEIAEHLPFAAGNCFRFVARAALRGDAADEADDYRKAAWYARREKRWDMELDESVMDRFDEWIKAEPGEERRTAVTKLVDIFSSPNDTAVPVAALVEILDRLAAHAEARAEAEGIAR